MGIIHIQNPMFSELISKNNTIPGVFQCAYFVMQSKE